MRAKTNNQFLPRAVANNWELTGVVRGELRRASGERNA